MGLPPRTKDVYINCVSFAHMVAPKGKYIAIVSTEIETEKPEQEIEAGLSLIRPILKQFTEVCDGFAVNPKRDSDGCHISATYDGTSHFQSVAKDVQRIFKDVTGEAIDMSIDSKMED